MIFSVGEACEAFHIVVSGQVKLFVVSPAGQEKVIEIISPGQSFAEALVFLDKPYILSAQALADTVLVNVSKRGVVSEIEQDPHFALHMLAGVSRRLHGLIQDVEAYALRNGMQRLIGYLLRDVEMDAAQRSKHRDRLAARQQSHHRLAPVAHPGVLSLASCMSSKPSNSSPSTGATSGFSMCKNCWDTARSKGSTPFTVA